MAFIDFDPHHDGILLAPVVGLLEGRSLYLEVFSQYGPIPAWLAAGFLFLFPGGDAIGLRILGVLLLGLSAFFIADSGRISNVAQRMPHSATITAALLWIFSWDGLLGTPLLTWSSLWASTILLSSLYLFLRWTRSEERPVFSSGKLLFFSGFLLGTLFFVRQSVGAVAMIFIAFVVVATLIRRLSSARIYLPLLGGLFLGGLLPVIVMIALGTLGDWWQQSVVWPIEWATERSNVITKFSQKFLPWTAGPAIAGVLMAFFLGATPARKLIFVIVPASAGAIYSAIQGKGFGSLDYFPEARVAPWSEFLWNFGHTTLASLFFVSASIVFLVGVQWAWRLVTRGSLEPVCGFLTLGSLSMLSQSVPVMESRHFWWGMAFPLIVSTLWVAQTQETLSRRENGVLRGIFVMLTIWVTVAPLSVYGANVLLVERSSYSQVETLVGMSGRPQEVERVVAVAHLLGNLREDLRTYYLVADGYWAVSSGRYLAADQYPVSWGQNLPLLDRIVIPSQLIVDDEVQTDRVLRFASDFQVEVCEAGESAGYRVILVGFSCFADK